MKADYARQELERFCIGELAKLFAAVNRRPPSINYHARHSRFKFVLTERTTLTPEKLEALREMNIDLKEHTEIRGIHVNYDVIRENRLETKLRDALASIHVSEAILEQLFTPQIQLKASFFDILSEVVRHSLKSGEKIEDKIFRVLEILNPATQMRNVETLDLSAKQSFDLLNNAEIAAEEKLA